MGPRRLAAVLVVVTLSAVALLARRESRATTASAPLADRSAPEAAIVSAPAADQQQALRVIPDRSAPSAESAPFVRAVDEAMASMHREHELDR